MQGKNLLTGLILAVLLLICGLAGAKAWAEATGPGVPAQQLGSTSSHHDTIASRRHEQPGSRHWQLGGH